MKYDNAIFSQSSLSNMCWSPKLVVLLSTRRVNSTTPLYVDLHFSVCFIFASNYLEFWGFYENRSLLKIVLLIVFRSFY